LWTDSPNFEVVVGKGSRNDRNGHESKLGGADLTKIGSEGEN
jgi:hypothetical protein